MPYTLETLKMMYKVVEDGVRDFLKAEDPQILYNALLESFKLGAEVEGKLGNEGFVQAVVQAPLLTERIQEALRLLKISYLQGLQRFVQDVLPELQRYIGQYATNVPLEEEIEPSPQEIATRNLQRVIEGILRERAEE